MHEGSDKTGNATASHASQLRNFVTVFLKGLVPGVPRHLQPGSTPALLSHNLATKIILCMHIPSLPSFDVPLSTYILPTYILLDTWGPQPCLIWLFRALLRC
jgi:hypothetical protein